MAFSPFGSQSSVIQGPTSLTLFKLSFCTTPTLRSRLLWTHLPNRDNLFAVFDSLFQKDLEGSVTEKKMLKLIRGSELLENIELENLVLQARLDEERSRSQYLQDIDRNVIVMVKKPLLAIRYQLPTGQMNFRPESGFDLARSVLQGLGLPIRERTLPANLPSSIPSTPALPTLNQGPQYHRPANITPGQDFLDRPTTMNGAYNYQPLNSVPAISSERPATAPMSFSQMLPPRRELPFAKAVPERPLIPHNPPPENLSDDGLQIDEKSEKAPTKRKPRAKPVKAAASELHREPSPPAPIQGSQSSTKVPKKRNRKQCTASKAKASKVSQDLPQVPDSQDTFSPPGSSRPARLAEASETTQTKEPDGTQASVKIHTSSTRDLANPVNPSSAPLVLHVGKKGLTALSASQTNGRQDSASSVPIPTTKNAPQMPQEATISPEEYMNRLDEWVRKYHDLPTPTPRPAPFSDLAAYAAQSDEDRLAALDTMICDCIEDENFIKLMEDVDRSWKRIGLGYRGEGL
ncbi:MAG: hypothetical protein Q9191_004090 [Dirinaria sp. TL-2023a]